MKRLLITTAFILTPTLAFAQPPGDFRDVVDIILDIIDLLIPLIFGIAFIVFIWGIVKAWIINAGDPAEVEKGRQLVVAGIIGFVVMSGIWGILALLRSGLFGF